MLRILSVRIPKALLEEVRDAVAYERRRGNRACSLQTVTTTALELELAQLKSKHGVTTFPRGVLRPGPIPKERKR